MRTYVDQLGRSITISDTPKKIISLVPSITELIADIGCHNRIVGCTKFCIHPKDLKEKTTIIGGTKNIRMKSIYQLNPDLIIANKEENNQKDIEQLMEHYPVWISQVASLEDSYDMINQLGHILGRVDSARSIIKLHQNLFNKRIDEVKSVAYLIWQDPMMTIGSDTFIHDVLRKSGYHNVFDGAVRYPEISIAMIKEKNPKVIFLSSEPFPFKEQHLNWWKEQMPNSQVILVDGEFFSWYGSRITHKQTYLSKLRSECMTT